MGIGADHEDDDIVPGSDPNEDDMIIDSPNRWPRGDNNRQIHTSHTPAYQHSTLFSDQHSLSYVCDTSPHVPAQHCSTAPMVPESTAPEIANEHDTSGELHPLYHEAFNQHPRMKDTKGRGIYPLRYTMLDIPYDSPTITTSEQLQSVNCIVYNPLRILVCYICNIAVIPNRLIIHHRSSPHGDHTLTKVFVNSLIQHHNLFLHDRFGPEISCSRNPMDRWPGLCSLWMYALNNIITDHGTAPLNRPQRLQEAVSPLEDMHASYL